MARTYEIDKFRLQVNPIISTALAVLFTLVDSGIDVVVVLLVP